MREKNKKDLLQQRKILEYFGFHGNWKKRLVRGSCHKVEKKSDENIKSLGYTSAPKRGFF